MVAVLWCCWSSAGAFGFGVPDGLAMPAPTESGGSCTAGQVRTKYLPPALIRGTRLYAQGSALQLMMASSRGLWQKL